MYAGVLAVAAAFLTLSADVATRSDEVDLGFLQSWLDAFQFTWDIGLLLFALHLIVLGYAIQVSRIARSWVGLGWIVVIAGVGYLIDAVAVVMNWDLGFELASILFVGEVVLIAWLLVSGFRKSVD